MLIWRLLLIVVVHAVAISSYRVSQCPIYPIAGERWTDDFFIVPPFTVHALGYEIEFMVIEWYGRFPIIGVGGAGGILAYSSDNIPPPSNGDGEVWMSSHVDDDPILQQASNDFKCFGAPVDFMPTWVLIGTWDEVVSDNDVSETASFQLVLATDGSTTWVRLSYGEIDFPAGGDETIRVGVDFDNDGLSDPGFSLDQYSNSPNADQVSTGSNVGCPGCYYVDMTSASGANGVPSPCDCPCVHGTCVESCSLNVCTCVDGWTGTNCDQDIDECVSETHTCDLRYQACVNLNGSFTCESLGCNLCDNPTGLYCQKYGFCFNVSTALASETCATGEKETYCKCLANKKETKTKWKCGKVKDAAVCDGAIVVETCGMINCIQSNHKKFCGKGVDVCVGTDTNFNVANIFGKKDHKSVTNNCT